MNLLVRGAAIHIGSSSVWKRPLAANQIVQLKLANMMTEITLGYASRITRGTID
ncbi:MAG: hypothetical protein U0X93_17370 [Anaerolineales bacterium]